MRREDIKSITKVNSINRSSAKFIRRGVNGSSLRYGKIVLLSDEDPD